MAYGNNATIPNQTGQQVFVPGGMQFASLAVLNPNDGVVYVKIDQPISGVASANWDWKVPSQSYALLPGPWHNVGLYYLDQSGAGRAGDITIYPSAVVNPIPIFQSIGRAIQAQSTTLDVVEGAQPPNPGVGIARLWIDTNDDVNVLNNAGVNSKWLDTDDQITSGIFAGSSIIGPVLAPAIPLIVNGTVESIGSTLGAANNPMAAMDWNGAVARFYGYNPGAATWQATEMRGSSLVLASMVGDITLSPAANVNLALPVYGVILGADVLVAAATLTNVLTLTLGPTGKYLLWLSLTFLNTSAVIEIADVYISATNASTLGGIGGALSVPANGWAAFNMAHIITTSAPGATVAIGIYTGAGTNTVKRATPQFGQLATSIVAVRIGS